MKIQDVISSRQIRAARALLNWSQEGLAQATQLSIATIRKLELGHISPRLTTNRMIRETFEEAGLEFIEPEGVRYCPDEIFVLHGEKGMHAFFDNVYQHARKHGGEIVSVCPSEAPYIVPYNGAKDHTERMTRIKNTVSVKCLLTEDIKSASCAEYCEYRWLPKSYMHSVPFYVYGDVYATFVFEADPSPKIIAIKSHVISKSFREQFHSLWSKAAPLDAGGKDEKLIKVKSPGIIMPVVKKDNKQDRLYGKI